MAEFAGSRTAMSDATGTPRRTSKVDSATQYQLNLLTLCSSISLIALSISVVIYTFAFSGNRPLGIFFLVLGILTVGALALSIVRIRRDRSRRV
jgi:hypothetical protein